MKTELVGITLTSVEEIFSQKILIFDIASSYGDSPNVYIQSGLHPNETTGCGVLYSLLEKYKTEKCPVNLRVIPHVNPLGWRTYIETGNGRFSNPNFVNWNRIFGSGSSPASDRPTVEKSMADLLVRLSSGYDHVLDLHTPECGWPHIYSPTFDARLNTFDDLPHVIYGEPELFAFAEYHVLEQRREGSSRCSATTLELPSYRPQSLRDLDYWANRLHCELESIRQNMRPPARPPQLAGDMVDFNSKIDGICYPVADPGRQCKAGELIANILSPAGERDQVFASVDTVPLCFRRGAVARAGSWAVRCLAWSTEIDAASDIQPP